jgi:hypothetical protein
MRGTWLRSHWLRMFLYRHLLRVSIGQHSSIHRNCRRYRTPSVSAGTDTIMSRDVSLDGRAGVQIGNNVSISVGLVGLTLEHDLAYPLGYRKLVG